MSGTPYRTSDELKMASAAASAAGNMVQAYKLAAAANAAHRQECEADYEHGRERER